MLQSYINTSSGIYSNEDLDVLLKEMKRLQPLSLHEGKKISQMMMVMDWERLKSVLHKYITQEAFISSYIKGSIDCSDRVDILRLSLLDGRFWSLVRSGLPERIERNILLTISESQIDIREYSTAIAGGGTFYEDGDVKSDDDHSDALSHYS